MIANRYLDHSGFGAVQNVEGVKASAQRDEVPRGMRLRTWDFAQTSARSYRDPRWRNDEWKAATRERERDESNGSPTKCKLWQGERPDCS